MPEAARHHDEIAHTEVTTGFLTGAVAAAGAAWGTEALVTTAVEAGAMTGGVGFLVVLGIGALACWGLPALGAAAGRWVQKPAEGQIVATSHNIFINGRPAAHTHDPVSCHSGEIIAEGSKTVIFNRELAARHGDRTTQGGVIVSYSPNVIIGGPTATVAPIDDIPAWAQWAALAIELAPGLGRLAGRLIGKAAAGAFGRAAEAGADLVGKTGGEAGGEAAAAEEGAAATAGEDSAAGGRAEESTATAASEGEPVNPATGAVFSDHVDFVLPGPLPLQFARVWTSRSTIRGELGYGWHHSLDLAVIERGPNRLAVRLADGRFALFDRPGAGAPSLNLRERLQLWDVDGRYQLTDYRARAWLFGDACPDGVRRLAQVCDANGNAIRLHRDAAGGLDGIVDCAGRVLDVRRDTQGRITAILGPHPAGEGQLTLVRFAYDAAGDLVATQDANGDGFQYGYDRHLLSTIRWPAALVFHFRYDDPARRWAARCVETVGEDGLFLRRLTYDDAARTTTVRDGFGTVRLYEWNTLGRVVAFTDGLGRRSTTTYDRWSHVVAETRADGATRSTAYDAVGRVVSAADYDGAVTRYDYAPPRSDGLLTALAVEVRAADGGTSRFRYDDRANLVSAIRPGGAETRFVRDTRGLVLAVQDRIGLRRRFAWDAAGLPVWEASTQAARVRFAHDALGRLVETQRAGEQPVRYARDAVGRVVEVVRADGRRVRLAYDQEGQVTSHTNAAGRVTRWEYGGLPYPVRRIAADGTARLYEYDDDLRLVGLTNAKGERYTLGYDLAGQLVEEVGFDDRCQRYAYDAAGFLAEHQDEEGRGAVFRRDPLGRLLERRFADGTVQQYRYDKLGRMVGADNAARRVGFVWAADGTLAEEHQDDLVLRHACDARGRRVETVLPDGRRVRVEWNGDDTVASVRFEDTSVARYTRDALGREITRHSGGLAIGSDYDPQGRLIRQVAHGRAREAVLGRRYSYDDADRVAAIDDLLGGQAEYRYDAQERLIGVDGDDPEAFVIDPAGNILAGTGEASGVAVGDRLLFRGDRKFEYDGCGNRVREVRGAGGGVVVDYRYGPDNQLKEVEERSRRGRRVTRFAYDALGRRVSKESAWAPPAPANDVFAGGAPVETTMRFLWDGNVLVAETQSDDPLATVYLHEPGSFRPLAQVRRDAGGQADAVYHYHLDQVGTPREVTNDNGRVVWRGRLKAWGALAAEPVAEVAQPLRFQGQYADAETGLHYNRFRYYAPAEGCYVQQDPIGLLGGVNLASYVSDPASAVDPFGLAKCPMVTRDDMGRPTEWSSEVSPADIGTGSPTNQATRDFARSIGNPTDDAGHALGNNLGGSGTDTHNIFPQAPSVNRGSFRTFEGSIADRVTATGQPAQLSLQPNYLGNSMRPSELNYTASFADGAVMKRTFPNP